MSRLKFWAIVLVSLFPARANAQAINLERSFPDVPFLLSEAGLIGDHKTNLDIAGGIDAVIQVPGGYDVIDLGTGQIVVSLRWADFSAYWGETVGEILGFADLDNDGQREMVLRGGGHILVVDPHTLTVKLDIAPPSPLGSFIGYTVGSIGDLDGDGADEMLVYVVEYYQLPNTGGGVVRALMYGSGPSTSAREGAGFAALRNSLQIRPNPSIRAIQIALDSPGDDIVSLRIFDVAGRLVREFRPSKGLRELQWDGLDSEGHRLAAGVYLCEMSSPSGTRATRKLVRID